MANNRDFVVIDFAGTLIKPEIIEEANKFRAAVLERALPTIGEHANPDELYRNNRELVEKITGIEKDMEIVYRENDGDFQFLTGEECQNQIATTLFQIGMYAVAKKHGMNIYPEGFVEQLRRIRDIGYGLAIVSGVRADIISGMFAITGLDLHFPFYFGQPPILGISNEENVRHMNDIVQIGYLIGDKLSDLEPGPTVGAKTIFAKWGHPDDQEAAEEFADYSIEKPEELENIIK
ncbi:MAG: HAD family hydrolase [Nanoarchaeota archaeon]|nr:HAD family hydrolase [Nanoarchaeota archaeon]